MTAPRRPWRARAAAWLAVLTIAVFGLGLGPAGAQFPPGFLPGSGAVTTDATPPDTPSSASGPDAGPNAGPNAGPGAEIPAVAPGDLEALARLIEDPAFADWLRAQAGAVGGADRAAAGDDGSLAAAPDSVAGTMVLQGQIARFEATLLERVGAWMSLGQDLERFSARMGRVVPTDDRIRHLVFVVIFLLIGSGLEWLYWQSAGPLLRRIEGTVPAGPWQAFRRTGLRLGLNLGGLALFSLGALGAFLTFDWHPVSETAILLALGSLILLRLIAQASVFVLAPFVPALRLAPLDDRGARWLFGWIMATATLVTFGLVVLTFWSQVGGPDAPTGPLADLVAATLVAMLLLRVWFLPRMLTAPQPMGNDPPPAEDAAADRLPDAGTLEAGGADAGDGADGGERPDSQPAADPLHRPTADTAPPGDVAGTRRRQWLATATILLLWALWLIGADRILLTVLVMVLIGPAIVAVRFLAVDPWQRYRAERHAAAHAGTGLDAGELPEPPTDFISPILGRLARFAAIVAALLLLAAVWHDIRTDLAGGPLDRLIQASADILVALLIAELVWTLARTAIDRRLHAFQATMGPGAGGGEGGGGAVGSEARLATLLPLIRNTVMTLLLAMVALIGLSSLGINIGPLLAGAGVVGIAVGFGAQTLVRDIVSGIFFLIDDAFRVGEYIEMDTLRGTVEGISLRSMKLRHHRGAVHTVPFGEIKSVTNYSRDWVIVKLEFRVPFETDLGLVKKLVKQIGRELLDDETLGPQFMEPVKSQGVRRMEEFNMVIGVKFMTKPGEQWLIRREVYQRIRDTFEARGIHFAQRNVKVEVIGAGDGPIDEATRKAAVGAAQDAIERQAGVADPA